MAKAKKLRAHKKVQFQRDNNNSEDAEKTIPDVKAPSPEPKPDESVAEKEPHPQNEIQMQGSESVQGTVTSSESTKRRVGSVRGISSLHKVITKKAQGKKYKLKFNELGVPIGQNRTTLQSYIGMAARNKIPIDIPSWPEVDRQLKVKLWLDVKDTFKIVPELEEKVLQSAGSKWRQFKTTLTTKYVMPYIGQKKKLRNPPKQYSFVGKDAWRRFVATRTNNEWLSLHNKQSERVKKRKYHHRLSRKGYIGLQEEEIKEGKLERGEIPDRAIFWKKARKPKDESLIDEDLAMINAKIDDLLEKKEKGEFEPSGSNDVLSVALETPEHSGRVRGVGGFVSPKLFFNLPRQRIRVSKAQLSEELARQKKRDC